VENYTGRAMDATKIQKALVLLDKGARLELITAETGLSRQDLSSLCRAHDVHYSKKMNDRQSFRFLRKVDTAKRKIESPPKDKLYADYKRIPWERRYQELLAKGGYK
jgi:hypothetical protein